MSAESATTCLVSAQPDTASPRGAPEEFLVGEQSKPGGRFEIDWTRSGAVDHSSFTPSNHGGGGAGLDVSYNMQYSCCGKSAFTKSGRRILLHAGVQNSGSYPRENAYSLAREVFFDQRGLLRQVFVPELAALRGTHHAAQRYTVDAGATLPVPLAGNQLEIKSRRLNVASLPTSTWGLIVFGSADLKQGTKIGFNEHHFFVDRCVHAVRCFQPPLLLLLAVHASGACENGKQRATVTRCRQEGVREQPVVEGGRERRACWAAPAEHGRAVRACLPRPISHQCDRFERDG